MIENPYTPPSVPELESSAESTGTGRTFSKSILLVLCAAVFVIAWLSISTGLPALYAPFPFFVIVPSFLGFPRPIIALALSGIFALSQISHFRCTPREKPNVGFTILLLSSTALSALAIIAGGKYGFLYQGLFYCVFVAAANVAFASTAWGLWWVARKNSGSYRIQVLFGFTLFAWISWYALPYIGDM